MFARALALVAVLALSACTGSSTHPRVLPTLSSPTASASASAAPVAEVPAAARVETPQGASAFAKFWFEQLDRSYRHGVSFDAGLSDAACKSCRNFTDNVAQLVAQGQHWDRSTFTNITAESPPLQGERADVSFSAVVPARMLLTQGGALVKSYPADPRLLLIFQAQWSRDHWLAYRIYSNPSR